jgi:hypothetical protein
MKLVKFALVIGFTFMFALGSLVAQTSGAAGTGTASSGSKTVEESYLQESFELMVIHEQARSPARDMKFVALSYIKEAIDGGRKGPELAKELEYLAFEGTMAPSREAGTGRITNNFPDVRAKACEYLGEIGTPAAKDTLVKVMLAETEPMVLAAACKALGKIGLNENDEVTLVISYIVERFTILGPDNILALEALNAFEAIADKAGGIKDPAAIRAIINIAEGNYIKPVQQKAKDLLSKLRKLSAGGK